MRLYRFLPFLILFIALVPFVGADPEPRIGARMVYDPMDQRFLLFGGAHYDNGYTFYDDLWSFDPETETWTEIETTSSPEARFNSMLVYLPERHQLFLAGGFSARDRIMDTWIYDIASNNWIKLHPETPPSRRSDSAMAYYPENDVIVLYSGYLLDDLHPQDTWIYSFSDENWIEQETVNSPLGQYGNYMVYAEETGQLLMYPGHWSIYSDGELVNHGYGGNIWEYNIVSKTWTEYHASLSPPGRYWGYIVYDSTDNRIILYGGHGTIEYDDTWTYSVTEESWTDVSKSTRPPKRNSIAMAYSPDYNIALLFGGLGQNMQSLGDTWILDCDAMTWIQVEVATQKVPTETTNTGIPGYPAASIALALAIIYLAKKIK